ncbi:MAG: class A beta-lactamase-related serine hydrolase [Elusimicrobia bacterium]|nr:class A beta-lactamase-related serine hydrolase [Candidatus Obscuribacterium magneticum]
MIALKRIRKRLAELEPLPDFSRRPIGTQWRWGGLVLLLIGLFLCISLKKKPEGALPPRTEDARWTQMVTGIVDTVRSYEGEVGIYIKDLKSGRTFEWNADVPFVSASLIKLPIMAAVFQAIKEGAFSLDTRLVLRRVHRRAGSGTLKWSGPGSRYSVSYLIYEMMTRSDNTATAILVDRLGFDYLNTCFERMGLETTRISKSGMSLADRLQPEKDNYTTAREMGFLLDRIYRRRLITDGLSDLMLEVMKGTHDRHRLAAPLPKEWKLAHKTGLLRRHCHDVGIVFTPEGDYVICVLTGQNGNYRKAKRIIASVGRQAYAYMGSS